MKNVTFRTDLAIEEVAKIDCNKIEGVNTKEFTCFNILINKTKINKKHDKRLSKKAGLYYTLDLQNININDNQTQENIIKALSKVLIEIIESKNLLDKKAMVIGLGNINVTPDSLGPYTLDNIIVTRHLFSNNIINEGYSEVSGYSPGVMGTTGIETSDIVGGIFEKVNPDFVIVVDALASLDSNRVNKTIQITDTGISPGSGVGNKRKEISSKSLNVPVIAIGVPTVVDAVTLTNDVLDKVLIYLKKHLKDDANKLGLLSEVSMDERKMLMNDAIGNTVYNMIVTPKEVDEVIEDFGKIIASSIDIALHKRLRDEYIINH